MPIPEENYEGVSPVRDEMSIVRPPEIFQRSGRNGIFPSDSLLKKFSLLCDLVFVEGFVPINIRLLRSLNDRSDESLEHSVQTTLGISGLRLPVTRRLEKPQASLRNFLSLRQSIVGPTPSNLNTRGHAPGSGGCLLAKSP
jgi:hypothetical protein